ncbi:MAG: nucleotide exchange factor GrpE, partial [Verrucomicrobiota bacterium]
MTENDNPFVSADEPNAENAPESPAPADAGGEVPADANADGPAEEAPAEGEAAAPVDPLMVLQGEVDQWKDRYLRSQADLENYRTRMAREMGDARRYANADLMEDLLPV